MTIFKDLVGSTVPEPDDASADVTRPDSALAYLSVEPWQVEHGDIILGLRTPVASILTDGQSWFYGDDKGTFIAKRPSWGKVQVIRSRGKLLAFGPPTTYDDGDDAA